MIEIKREATPYLLSGTVLASVCTLSFFKGVSTLFRLISPSEKESSGKETSIHKLFGACAWFGVTVVSGYGLSQLTRSFFDVPQNKYDFSYLKPFDDDLEEFKGIYEIALREKPTLRDFCMAGFQSRTALNILEKTEPSQVSLSENPGVSMAKSALKVVERLDAQALQLNQKLSPLKINCENSFAKLQADLKNRTVAHGVNVNFDQLCETVFLYVVPTLCNVYQRQKEYLESYQVYQILVNNYRKDLINEYQFERCKKTYNYQADFDGIHSTEYIEAASNATEGELLKLKKRLFG
jgi:hypothetical protein